MDQGLDGWVCEKMLVVGDEAVVYVAVLSGVWCGEGGCCGVVAMRAQ